MANPGLRYHKRVNGIAIYQSQAAANVETKLFVFLDKRNCWVAILADSLYIPDVSPLEPSFVTYPGATEFPISRGGIRHDIEKIVAPQCHNISKAKINGRMSDYNDCVWKKFAVEKRRAFRFNLRKESETKNSTKYYSLVGYKGVLRGVSHSALDPKSTATLSNDQILEGSGSILVLDKAF